MSDYVLDLQARIAALPREASDHLLHQEPRSAIPRVVEYPCDFEAQHRFEEDP